MSEGNTAFQVSPFNPEDTMSVRSFFEKIADTVVDASELSKEVARLRKELQELSKEVEEVRANNWRMDGEIVELRSQRDEARRESAEKGTRIGELELAARNYEARTESLARQLEEALRDRDEYQSNYRSATRERDDAQMKVMELEDRVNASGKELEYWQGEAKACQTKLDTLKSIFS